MKKLTCGAAMLLAATCSTQAIAATVVDFSYTGSIQSWLVPTGVTSLFVETWGAQGYSTTAYAGGLGGYTSGTLAVTPGEMLSIFVGGQGQVANVVNTPMGGGFNGGGDGVVWSNGGGMTYAGGGGGASDVRRGTSLADRLIVAGGGGGATDNGAVGGAGGGAIGGNAIDGYPGGTGGTQASGGSIGGTFGLGGSGLPGNTGWVGGGGGGWYGGGASEAHGAGGGGSSYIGGVTGGLMTQGVRTGNGAVRFSFDAATAAVPEPSTWLTMILGFGAIGVGMRRKQRQTVRYNFA